MGQAVRGTLVVVVAIALGAGPAAAAERRYVAPDGRAMAYGLNTPFLASDTDTGWDVYSWNRGTFELASPGPGSDPYGSMPRFVSDDGTRVVFATRDPLDPSDTDGALDVYETTGGVTSLVSTGPADAAAPLAADFAGASEDGTRVFFETTAPLVADDTDDGTDIYMRSGGATTLVSTSPAGAASARHKLVGVSRNGERVVELTAEQLVPEDTDSENDLYQRFEGGTTLVSEGDVADSSPDGVTLAIDVTPDAKSIVVITQERFVAADDNEDFDLYQFSRGRTTLVTSRSDGSTPECPRSLTQRLGLEPPSRRPPCEPHVFGQTDTGSKVLFWSPKPLDSPAGTLLEPNDDTTGGLFEKSSDGTTRLIDEHAAGESHAIAADGSRHIVQSRARWVAADTDDQNDLYLHEGGSWALLSGPGPDWVDHRAIAFSTDARRVFWETSDRLVPEDTNSQTNVYVNTDSGPKLALTGPADTDPAGLGAFVGASALGNRWFFFTTRPLVAGDTDGEHDLYLRRLDGTTRQLSP